jgi:hypothetical protein
MTQQSVVRVKALAKPGTICEGNSTSVYAIPSGGKIVHYTWSPGNVTDSSTSISPVDTATYVVTAEDAFGCIAKDSIKVNVIPKPGLPVVSPLSICPDSTATLSILNADFALVYNWYAYASGGDLKGTGTLILLHPLPRLLRGL